MSIQTENFIDYKYSPPSIWRKIVLAVKRWFFIRKIYRWVPKVKIEDLRNSPSFNDEIPPSWKLETDSFLRAKVADASNSIYHPPVGKLEKVIDERTNLPKTKFVRFTTV